MFNKLLVTVALISAAAAVAGLGTFATFTSTTSASRATWSPARWRSTFPPPVQPTA